MTPEDAEAALTGFMFGQASRLLASARRGNASTGTWKEWEEEWQAMFAALRKTWREASATEVSGPTGPASVRDRAPKRTPHIGCDHLIRGCLYGQDQEGQEGEEG